MTHLKLSWWFYCSLIFSHRCKYLLTLISLHLLLTINYLQIECLNNISYAKSTQVLDYIFIERYKSCVEKYFSGCLFFIYGKLVENLINYMRCIWGHYEIIKSEENHIIVLIFTKHVQSRGFGDDYYFILVQLHRSNCRSCVF